MIAPRMSGVGFLVRTPINPAEGLKLSNENGVQESSGVRTPINPAEGLKLNADEMAAAIDSGPNTHQPSRGIETVLQKPGRKMDPRSEHPSTQPRD